MAAHSKDPSTGRKPKIWRSNQRITVPAADILSFAFANLGQYDENKPIFVDANEPSSYVSAHDARVTVRRLIKGLKAQGLQAGDCVCLHAFNNIWYPLLWLGVIGAGGCVSGSNPAYTSSELAHHLNATNTKYIVAQVECSKAADEAAAQCQIPKSHLFLIAKPGQALPADSRSWRTLLDYGEADWDTALEAVQPRGEKIAVYATTSGTTGLPKAATIPHRYVVAQSVMVEERLQNRPYQPSQLVCLPVFHAFAAQIGLVLPLRLGITTYFMSRFKLQDFVRIVKTFKITDTAIVPPILTALTDLPPASHDALNSLRYIICAGAPITANVQSKFYTQLSSEAVIAQCWGATELGWVTLFDWKEKDTSGSVGRLMPDVELKIVDDDDNPVPEDGVHGEAYIRSPSMFLGYRNNPQASAFAFDRDGFYRTGDRVYMREHKLFVDGRIKDIMKVNGWQVSPAEIESVLLQHTKIADAAVVGITKMNESGLEETLPCAYVVRAVDLQSVKTSKSEYDTPPDSPLPDAAQVLTEREVQHFVASKLASYKRLSGGVVFIKKIPRNTTGKILRRLLSESQLDSPMYKSEGSLGIGSPASAHLSTG